MSAPLAPTGRGWGYLLAALVVAAVCPLAGLRDLWYLPALLGALVLLALLWLAVLPRLAGFHARATTSDPTPTVGERIELTTTVEHRLPFALPVRVRWQAVGLDREADLVLAPGRRRTGRAGGGRSLARVLAERRGPQRVGITDLTVVDPLGLAQRRVRLDARVELLVLPALHAGLAATLDAYASPGARDRAAVGSAPGIDSGLPSGAIREYRSGDALRQIHWKQSARQGELLVKLHDERERAERSLRLVTEAAAYAADGADAGWAFETAVSAAATLAVHWVRGGEPVLLQLDDDAPLRCDSEGEVLRRLASAVPRIPALGAAGDAPGLQAAGAALPGAVVTGLVSASLDEVLRLSPVGGLLLTTGDPSATAAPSRWRRIAVPHPTTPGADIEPLEVVADA